MNRKIVLIGSVIGLALLVFVIYFVTRPSAAFEQLHEAIAKQDRNAMNRLIDFPNFRESIKLKLRDELGASAANIKNPLALVGVMLAEKLMDPLVDILVSPGGIAAIMAGHKMRDMPRGRLPTGEQEVSNAALQFVGTWDGPSRYAVAVTSKGNQTVTLVLHRHSLFEWRLAELR